MCSFILYITSMQRSLCSSLSECCNINIEGQYKRDMQISGDQVQLPSSFCSPRPPSPSPSPLGYSLQMPCGRTYDVRPLPPTPLPEDDLSIWTQKIFQILLGVFCSRQTEFMNPSASFPYFVELRIDFRGLHATDLSGIGSCWYRA